MKQNLAPGMFMIMYQLYNVVERYKVKRKKKKGENFPKKDSESKIVP